MAARTTTGFARIMENRNLLQKLSAGLRFVKLKKDHNDSPAGLRGLREMQSHDQARPAEVVKPLPVHFVAAFICISLGAWSVYGYFTHPQTFSQGGAAGNKPVTVSECRQLPAPAVSQPVQKTVASEIKINAVVPHSPAIVQQNSCAVPIPKSCEEIALNAEAGLE